MGEAGRQVGELTKKAAVHVVKKIETLGKDIFTGTRDAVETSDAYQSRYGVILF
jgi:hypothetical protein